MRIVVAGAGNIGRHLANDLNERGHQVTVIEQDTAVVDRAQEDAPGVSFILGDACEPWVLDKAEVRTCDVMVAATGDDEDNLVISLLSKQEYGVPHVVARVNHPKNEWLFTEAWGVDVPMSPPHVLTALVEEAVTVGDLVRLLKLERGQVTLVELTIDETAPVAGRPLYELRLPPDSAIVAILRRGHVVIPQPETQLVAGDEIMAIATQEAEDRLRAALMGEST
ncbi:MAG: potassium channel family protein [Actinomycetota bacterium]